MKAIYQFKNDYFQKVNWMLLLFLVLVLNVKTPVKIAAIVIVLLLNRKLFFEKGLYRQKFIWFYFSLIAIALLHLLLNISSLTTQYLLAASVGIFFWFLSIGTGLLNSWFVVRTSTEKLHTTIKLFFILNALVTLGQLFLIILDAGAINPFRYQGMHQKYFMGTGDYMTGISFDVSTTNAILNSFGIVYFLQRNKMGLVLLCMTVLLLTASNFTNVILLLVLLFVFVFRSDRNQKTVILVCLFLLVIFLGKISPQNDNYVTAIYNKVLNKKAEPKKIATPDVRLTERPDSILTAEEKKQKKAMLYLDSLNLSAMENKQREDSLLHEIQPIAPAIQITSKPTIPKPSIHTEPFQRRRDTTEFQKELLQFAVEKVPAFDTSLKQTKSQKIPGKVIALQQTISFLRKHPAKIIAGCGIGNFSSKLAFRITGLQMAGSYPKKMSYINNDFLNNHLDLYLNYFSKDIELHSLVNSPNSVYDQLLAEYGLLGIVSFILLYLGFFIRHHKKLSYGIPLLMILLGAFGIEYWYEQLTIVIIFELLMLLNIKESMENK